MLVGAAVLVGAAAPASLSGVSGGLWEVSGVPGTKVPLRQCIANVLMLSQVEHRGHNCRRTIVSDNGSSTVVSYSCAGAGFGRSQIDVLTPRSLRISTQGISDQLPFGYTVQAHRIGDC